MSTPNCAACDHFRENCLSSDRCQECKADLRDTGVKTGFEDGRGYVTNGIKKLRTTPVYHRNKHHSKIGASGGRGEH